MIDIKPQIIDYNFEILQIEKEFLEYSINNEIMILENLKKRIDNILL
jgi:hypothetical protein